MKKIHGNKGRKLTEEHKRKIGDANKISKIKHGMFGTRFYRIYYKMFERCKENHPRRKNYFDKGITVCKRWQKFKNFHKDMFKQYTEHCEEYGIKQTTIDRVNNNKGYSPNNCRWASYKVQNINRECK